MRQICHETKYSSSFFLFTTECLKYSGAPLYGHPDITTVFFFSTKSSSFFFFKITRLLRTPVHTGNGHFSMSQVTNSYRSSTPFYGHCLHGHCTLSIVIYMITVLPFQADVGQLTFAFFFQYKAKLRTFLNESIACRFSRTVK